MDGFDITIGTPRHGWLPVELSIAGATYEFAASYVLHDPMSELATACLHLLNGTDIETVRFWLEPEWYVLDLIPCSTSTMLAKFSLLANEDDKMPESAKSVVIDIVAFCHLVAKVLRNIGDELGPDRYLECAGRVFPNTTISFIYDILRSRRCG